MTILKCCGTVAIIFFDIFQVLAVFNLKDPQSQFGDWISLFLKAAFMAEGTLV